MNLNVGSRIEGLQFALFCTFSVKALVDYSLTDDKAGGEINDFLEGLIAIMILNFAILVLIVLYEHILKPLICKPSTRAAPSSSITHPDSFHFQDTLAPPP